MVSGGSICRFSKNLNLAPKGIFPMRLVRLAATGFK